MSEEVSTKQTAKQESTTPSPIQPWSAESEADKLMDDLFSDIDRILEGGTKLPTEPAKPEYVSLQSIVIPPITTPQTETILTEEQQQLVAQAIDDAEPGELLQQPESPTLSPETKSSGWPWEKLLWAVGLTSVAATIIMLLISPERQTWLSSKLSNMGLLPAQKTQVSESDAQFIQYALRSLERIDRKTEANQQNANATGGTGNSSQQARVGAGNQSSAPNQSTTILEKTVYYPVYPPQSPPATSVPLPVAPSPALSSTAKVTPPKTSTAKVPSPANPTAKVPSPASSPTQAASPANPTAKVPSTVTSPTQAASPTNPTAKAPSTVTSPTQAASPATSTQAAAPAPVTADTETSKTELPPAPAAQHALVGLIELEAPEPSAALFSINGVTQRFKIGEAIGNSGWTLVSVDNKEAIIRRNGEVRSVYIGQQF
ncbi:MAG: hypothetical protein F6K21_26280 [Symploca sp. SIO2D2]|nr:hypothetical protein [Symploca sp. SIO2D2]